MVVKDAVTHTILNGVLSPMRDLNGGDFINHKSMQDEHSCVPSRRYAKAPRWRELYLKCHHKIVSHDLHNQAFHHTILLMWAKIDVTLSHN